MTTKFEATVEIDRIGAMQVPSVQHQLAMMAETVGADNLEHSWMGDSSADARDRDLYIGIRPVDLHSDHLRELYEQLEIIGENSMTASWVEIVRDDLERPETLYIGPDNTQIAGEAVRHRMAEMRRDAQSLGGSASASSLVVGTEADGSPAVYMVGVDEEHALEALAQVREAVADGRLDPEAHGVNIPDSGFTASHAVDLDSMMLAAHFPGHFGAKTVPREMIDQAQSPAETAHPGA